MSPTDLAVEIFFALRKSFFDADGRPITFALRDKKNTQDDPLDEYFHRILAGSMLDVTCVKAPGPLVTPDFVVLREGLCRKAVRGELKTNVACIVAVECKKLERTRQGTIARSSGLDYNTTPPCGVVRIYDATGKAVDVRCFYLFVCLEASAGGAGTYFISALALCDGNLLNEDFDYYLSIVGERTKDIGLGTYGDGANRNRPMLIFSNPLGASQLDHAVTLVHTDKALSTAHPDLRVTHLIQRSVVAGGFREFYGYRVATDVTPQSQISVLRDPFPRAARERKTQPRGKFWLNVSIPD